MGIKLQCNSLELEMRQGKTGKEKDIVYYRVGDKAQGIRAATWAFTYKVPSGVEGVAIADISSLPTDDIYVDVRIYSHSGTFVGRSGPKMLIRKKGLSNPIWVGSVSTRSFYGGVEKVKVLLTKFRGGWEENEPQEPTVNVYSPVKPEIVVDSQVGTLEEETLLQEALPGNSPSE
jgi:hypothetical protein